MAEERLSILARLQNLASGGLRALRGDFGKLRDSAKGIAEKFAVVTVVLNQALELFGKIRRAVTRVVAGFVNLARRGQEVADVSAAFVRVTGDQARALSVLRGATEGLISNYDLMVGLNRAVTLGSAENTQQFAELAKTALALGRALGVDAAFALESLSLGIGRQSRLILDNLGLIVRVKDANKAYASQLKKNVADLTANERAEAFRTAALEAGRQKVEELGQAQAGLGRVLARFSVIGRNTVDMLAQMLNGSEALTRAFIVLANATEGLLMRNLGIDPVVEGVRLAFSRYSDDLVGLTRAHDEAGRQIDRLNINLAREQQSLADLRAEANLFEKLAPDFLEKRRLLLEKINGLEEDHNALLIIKEEIEARLDQLRQERLRRARAEVFTTEEATTIIGEAIKRAKPFKIEFEAAAPRVPTGVTPFEFPLPAEAAAEGVKPFEFELLLTGAREVGAAFQKLNEQMLRRTQQEFERLILNTGGLSSAEELARFQTEGFGRAATDAAEAARDKAAADQAAALSALDTAIAIRALGGAAQQLIASLRGGGGARGILGGIIGIGGQLISGLKGINPLVAAGVAVGSGIFSALLRPGGTTRVPVSLENYGPTALQQRRDTAPRAITQFIVVGGGDVGQDPRQFFHVFARLERLDAIDRGIPRGGR